jgi:hypothetical protein
LNNKSKIDEGIHFLNNMPTNTGGILLLLKNYIGNECLKVKELKPIVLESKLICLELFTNENPI